MPDEVNVASAIETMIVLAHDAAVDQMLVLKEDWDALTAHEAARIELLSQLTGVKLRVV